MNSANANLALGPSYEDKPFRLVRYYSMASLMGIVVVTIALLALHYHLTTTNFVEHESQANVQVTRLLANTDRYMYEKLLATDGKDNEEPGPQSMNYRALDVALRERIKGLPVVKIKVYRSDGMTVYSTNPAQVGTDKSQNPGFQSAMNHEVVSHLIYREKFDSFEGTIADRTLLASYVPLNFGDAVVPHGVIEVYSDATGLLARQQSKQWQIAGPIVAILAALYLFLFGVVRRAESIIRSKHTEGRKREHEAIYQALHDPLTGAKNRAAFSEALPSAIENALKTEASGALLYLDLDDFKQTNDGFGHAAGDELLIQVVQRVQQVIGPGSDLYRMGGDEFTVIAPDTSSDAQVAELVEKISIAMQEGFLVNDHQLQCSASIGTACFPRDGVIADEVMRHADLAMYKAKIDEAGPCPILVPSTVAPGSLPIAESPLKMKQFCGRSPLGN